LSTLRSDRLGNAGGFVTAQIVEHHNVLRPQRGREHLLDISTEALAVDRAVKDAGR